MHDTQAIRSAIQTIARDAGSDDHPDLAALDLRPGQRPYPIAIQRNIRLVRDEYRKAIAECAANGNWPLLFTGDAGTGKTCAALCTLDYSAGGRRYFAVADLCDELIQVMNGRREYGQVPDTIPAWWRRWAEMRLTVLDELAARQRVSDFHYDCVKRAIDVRHGKPAILVSNASLDQIARVYDDRIASRLAGGTVIRFAGEDRRLAHHRGRKGAA